MGREMRNFVNRPVMSAAFALGLSPSAALAICNVDYVSKPGDNLFSIAEEHYGDREHWELIFEQNKRLLAASTVIPGRTLFIPCPPEAETQAAAAPEQPEPAAVKPVATTPLAQADMTLLTGGNFGPFSGQDLPGQGMVTELITAALAASPSKVTFALAWDDDWTEHLFPQLDEKAFDIGFPWVKPDCAANPGHERCVSFHFSDPVVSLPVMLFVDAQRPIAFEQMSDLNGKTICRPNGYFNHDLDTADQPWMAEADIKVLAPRHPRECFSMLGQGRVDAVAMNLFLGAETIVQEGLRSQVVPLERPVGEIGLHAVISKSHWRGTSHLYRLNAGLKELRQSGQFDQIMTRHLETFWSELQ